MGRPGTQARGLWRGAVAAAVAVPLAVGVPTAASGDDPKQADIMGHRGASMMAPENTLAAYSYGARAHSDYLELDVQLTSDGVPALMHDATLTRTTDVEEVYPDGGRYVGDFTWAELQQLDAGSWYDERFAGERIPRLEDVPDVLRAGAGVNIELKDPDLSPGVEQVVADVLDSDPRWAALVKRDALVVSSFDLDSLATFHALAPEVPVTGIGDVPDDDATLDAYAQWMDGWVTNYRILDPADVDRVQATGMELVVYTVDAVEEMRELTALGVDGIVSDVPQVLRRVQQGKNPLPNANGVVVADVVGDAPGSDLTPDAGEYVLLQNTTDAPVDVSGWSIADAVLNRLDVGDGYVLPAGGVLRVHTGPGTSDADDYFVDLGRNVLNNNGDSVALFTDDDLLVSLYAYDEDEATGTLEASAS
jgi:glycerophosphoryl diester phosphodiesterase